MKQTPNYNLNKLEGPDTADLTQFNPNWNTLDTNLKQLSDDHVAHLDETASDPTPPHGMGTAASKNAQESDSDTTGGRLMQVGAFGLGARGIDIPGDDCNLITANGLYRLFAATINAWPGKVSGDTLIHVSWDSNYALQIGGSRVNKMWMRYNAKGTWQPWVEVITSAGGTMTGMLTLNDERTRISGFDGADNHIVRFTNDGDYIFKINRLGILDYRLFIRSGGADREIWHSGNLPHEEGTWTPVIRGETTAGTPTYIAQNGVYNRTGNQVYAWGRIQLSSKGGMAGDMKISGLPFTSRGSFRTAVIGLCTNITFPTNTKQLACYVVHDAVEFHFIRDGRGWLQLTDINVADDFILTFTAVYDI